MEHRARAADARLAHREANREAATIFSSPTCRDTIDGTTRQSRSQAIGFRGVDEEIMPEVQRPHFVLTRVAKHAHERRVHIDEASFARGTKYPDVDPLHEELKALFALLQGVQKRVAVRRDR